MLNHLKLVALACCTVSAAAVAGNGVRGPPPTSIVDVNLMSPVLGKAVLEYEVALGGAATVVLGPQLDLITDVPGLTGIDGFGAFVGMHLFPAGLATTGFWLGPELSFGYVGQANGLIGPGIYAQVDGLLGYTFFPAEHLALSAGIGGGYHFESIRVVSNGATAGNSGFGFAGRLGIGYGW